jgi:hypothetical protein
MLLMNGKSTASAARIAAIIHAMELPLAECAIALNATALMMTKNSRTNWKPSVTWERTVIALPLAASIATGTARTAAANPERKRALGVSDK